LNSFIQDKHGWSYRIAEGGSEHFKRFHIESNDIRIGYVNFHFEGEDVLFIDDFCIENKAVFRPWFWFGFISFPPVRWRTRSFRKRGIGTATVLFLADYARSQSAKRIEGKVVPRDTDAYPDLLNWYRRRGFTVIENDKETKISLVI
jgi:GNAT superfamily N-acetyltransferase